MHPRTREMCAQFGIPLRGRAGLNVLDPIGYHDSLCLTENARLVLTDSGGLQEESTYFRTPCLTLRPNTERPITVTVGSNKLTNPGQCPRTSMTCSAAASGLEKSRSLGRPRPRQDCRGDQSPGAWSRRVYVRDWAGQDFHDPLC